MGMLKMNRVPLPVSFMIVVSMVVALFIFFGAWAVTVDAANNERELSFAIGSNVSLGVNPLPAQPNTRTAVTKGEAGQSAADTWWGSSLLLACPLH
ncbi:MAG: hypothetical protein IH861_05990 [Chloroflexi bacterium]|nr:hypothetical protein [Chloroflexota bacterium]